MAGKLSWRSCGTRLSRLGGQQLQALLHRACSAELWQGVLHAHIGKRSDTSSGLAAGLNGTCAFGAPDPLATPEVRFQSGEGEDYCLPYSVASAAHHLGDGKLPPLLVEKASAIEAMERQMEEVRKTADVIGWKPKVLSAWRRWPPSTRSPRARMARCSSYTSSRPTERQTTR